MDVSLLQLGTAVLPMSTIPAQEHGNFTRADCLCFSLLVPVPTSPFFAFLPAVLHLYISLVLMPVLIPSVPFPPFFLQC